VSVLVVDDDESIRTLLAEIIEAEGYSVVMASEGQEAMALLQHHAPQLILLDLNMPVMSGEEFNRERVADPRLAQIPTILMTAADRMKERIAHLEITGAIAKPIELDELLKIVSTHCGAPSAEA